jgi:2-dehydro-3-deoxyphosphogluconate aldolase/(4S)-4-hydroxy-2-oxoglutarate aldolase
MARFDRLTVLNTIMAEAVMPLFNTADPAIAVQVVGALANAGVRTLEMTNRGVFAIEVFSPMIKECARLYPDMIIGVGTIDDPATAALYIQHGANFVIGPTFNPDVARLCNRHKIAYLPGCGTVSEIAQAEEYGSEIIKVFPGETLGPKFIKAVLGPRPWSRLMPTGGVEPEKESLKAWFEAGACAVGMGSKLVRADWIKVGNFDALTDLARTTLALIREVRGK